MPHIYRCFWPLSYCTHRFRNAVVWHRYCCHPEKPIIQKQRFCESISSVNWEAIYSESDTQTALGLFHSTLLKHFYKNFPKQTVKIRYNNRKPWLTQGLKDSIRMKNKLYRKYLKVKSVANEMNHKNYRNKLNQIVKVAEKQHYS